MCHVLIIEDELLIAMDLEALLSAQGAASFSFAETEEGALTQARAIRPDFITSDVSLMQGSGLRAAAAILTELGPIPVIFVTATPESCRSIARPEEIFRKPLDRPAIARAFRKMAFAA